MGKVFQKQKQPWRIWKKSEIATAKSLKKFEGIDSVQDARLTSSQCKAQFENIKSFLVQQLDTKPQLCIIF